MVAQEAKDAKTDPGGTEHPNMFTQLESPRGKRISTGKGGKDLSEEKGEDLRGKALGGKGGKDLNREWWQKILGRKREKISGGEDLGGKGLRGERGERISTPKKRGKDLREEKGECLARKRI